MARLRSKDSMEPLEHINLAETGFYDSEDEEATMVEHNISRSQHDYDMDEMDVDDASDQELQDHSHGDEETGYDESREERSGDEGLRDEILRDLQDPGFLQELRDRKYSQRRGSRRGRRSLVDYRILPMDVLYKIRTDLEEEDSELAGNGTPHRRPSAHLHASSMDKDIAEVFICIEAIVPSTPTAASEQSRFLVKTVGGDGIDVYSIRHFDYMYNAELQNPLFRPFLMESKIPGPQVSEEYSREVMGIKASPSSTGPPLPFPILRPTSIFAMAPVHTPAPVYAPAPINAPPPAVYPATRPQSLQKRPVYSFLQDTDASDLQPRQYAVSAYCAKAKNTKRQDLSVVSAQRLLKSLPPGFGPHPLPKTRAQKPLPILAYGPHAQFPLFGTLPKELRIKICKCCKQPHSLFVHSHSNKS